MMSVSKAEFAWTGGDVAGRISFDEEITGHLKDSIIQAIGNNIPYSVSKSARLYALRQMECPVGRYRIVMENSDLFIRVTSRPGDAGMEQAICDHLDSRGVNVNKLAVAGASLTWGGIQYRMDVRPFVEGRHFNSSDADLRSLAEVMASCHRALAEFPLWNEIRESAIARYSRLESLTNRLSDEINSDNLSIFAEHEDWARHNRSWIIELLDNFQPRLDLNAGSQCVHGELHRANVLYRRSDDAAVLVDFEESPFLFAPVSWDIAFMFQRFCLADNPSHRQALRRLDVVAGSYGSRLPELAPMMRQIAWFTLVTILALRIFDGVVTPADEYNKFLRLERQARRYEGVL